MVKHNSILNNIITQLFKTLHYILIIVMSTNSNYYIHMTFLFFASLSNPYLQTWGLGERGELDAQWVELYKKRYLKHAIMECIIAQTFHIMEGPTQKSLSSMPGPIMGTTGLRIARPYYGHHRTSYCPALLWAPQDFVNRSYCPALLWAPQDFVHRTSESCNVPPHQPQYNNAM